MSLQSTGPWTKETNIPNGEPTYLYFLMLLKPVILSQELESTTQDSKHSCFLSSQPRFPSGAACSIRLQRGVRETYRMPWRPATRRAETSALTVQMEAYSCLIFSRLSHKSGSSYFKEVMCRLKEIMNNTTSGLAWKKFPANPQPWPSHSFHTHTVIWGYETTCPERPGK